MPQFDPPKKASLLRVMGMDLSPTGSALTTLAADLANPPRRQSGQPEKNPPAIVSRLLLDRGRSDGLAEYAALRHMSVANLAYVSAAIGREIQDLRPDLVVLEDYSVGPHNSSTVIACTGEITGAAKLWMHSQGTRWIEVAAGTLKKFVTGSGAGKKEQVWLGAYKQWGVDTELLGSDNNVLDSYCLARFGIALVLAEQGLYDPTQVEKECFSKPRPGGAGRSSGKRKKGRRNVEG